MLHEDLVVRGPKSNYNLPEKWQLGEYMIDRLKKRNRDEVFCIDGITGKSLTCSKFVDETLKTAHILRNLGVKSGDVVSIIAENSISYLAPMLATFYIGGAANLLNPLYTPGELKRALNITQAKIVLCSKTALKNVQEVKNESEYIEKVILIEKSENTIIESLEELLEDSTINVESVEPENVDGEQTVLILLSSGTTGLPKCVMISHNSIRPSTGCFGDPKFVGIGSSDSSIAVLPFFHIFGASAILAAAVHSMKLVVLPTFQPGVFLKLIQEHKITVLYTVPPMVSFLLKHPIVSKFNISSVKWIVCSGGCLGIEIQDEFTKRFPNVNIRQIYGLTEMVGPCTVSRTFDHTKLATVGILIPDLQAMIWNRELKENVGPFKTGELCFRGPSVMTGYIEREDNDIDDYGFYHTGDLGYYDEDDHFYIVGRIKELIKYKGFQVAPAEIEDLIMKHDAVEECGVIGIPDERAGQLPTAVIVRQKNAEVTEKEIIEFVAERISIHKHLHGGVKFTESIPRNAAGKILRDKLFDLYKNI